MLIVNNFLIAKLHTPKSLNSPIVVSAESKIILTIQGIIKRFKVRFELYDEETQSMIKSTEEAIMKSPAYSLYFLINILL